MTSQEDLSKIHYVNTSDTALIDELQATGAVFNPDTTGTILHVSRPRGPADLAVKATVSLETPAGFASGHEPIQDIQTL